jgi:8-oxo-dGTP diphosphatase
MTAINQIVAPLALQADEQTEWSPVRLRVRTYLTSTLPPLDLVSAVRALVRQGSRFWSCATRSACIYCRAGGREPGETLMQTLEREVLEEIGWTIQSPRLIGLAHFQHLTPKPDDYRYPYPDFLHLIYAATADRYDAGKREDGGYELESGFQPLATVEALPISQGARALLRAAMTLQAFD